MSPDADKKVPPAGPTAGGAVDPEADASGLSAGMADIRSLLQRTATGLGAVATAVLVGLGWTQLHQIFPIPHSDWRWKPALAVAVLICAVIAAVFGSAWLAARFFFAQRRILVKSDLTDLDDLGPEKDLAQAVLDEHADEENAATLIALEQRGLRFARIARNLKVTNETRARQVAAEATRINDVVGIALTRAAATVLEDRARKAFRGWRTAAALALAAAGIIGAFAFADYYKGQRELVALREACHKAEEAGVVGACSQLEESAEGRVRRITAAADAAKKAVDDLATATASEAALSPAQRQLLARVQACSKASASREATKQLSPEERGAAVALCAARP